MICRTRATPPPVRLHRFHKAYGDFRAGVVFRRQGRGGGTLTERAASTILQS
jgi:hypothetical protein